MARVSAALPARLYKYRSLAPASLAFTEAFVTRGELYFSLLDNLNDPLEGHYATYAHSISDPVMLDPDFQEAFNQACLAEQESLARVRSSLSIGVLSLSEKADDPVMWSPLSKLTSKVPA